MSFAKYSTVLFASMLKFLGGPLAGLALKLSWYETVICTILGMMLTVSLVIFLRTTITRLLKTIGFRQDKPRKRFTKTSRLAIKIRSRFGLMGIAFLTPLLFSPAGGTILALAFRYSRNEILLNMFLSAVGWGFVQTLFFYYLKDLIF